MAEDQPPRLDSQPRDLEREKETAWSNFMDDMERKLPQTGPYFLFLGKKGYMPNQSGDDHRAFIPIKPVFDKANDIAEYIVISRKGARSVSQKDIESILYDSLDNVRKGFPQNLQDLSHVVVEQHRTGPPFLYLQGKGVKGDSISARIDMNAEVEEQVVQTAIKESIELVKTSAAEHQIAKAKSLSSFLDTLSSGETGPSAPNPLPTPPSV